ncbi:peptidoglycan-binding protein [Bacillus sp. SD075]|uniref:peptidoglycan-binding domain-containing protein n=1 Tax=Bacillus sp. SD075 TaxID=2781732 RepID=UPI001A95FF07|nr:peptidoglycan-binding domain-containing protein [Bacillus sp. SD075]MBO0999558.1 peptidoglycan-binding protein [Bacillus sp. SD075]
MLRINELDNAIDYLEKASFHYKNREDKYWFKWLTISLHGALYGFGVCAVQGSSASLRVLKTPRKKKIKEFLPMLSELFLTPDEPYSNDHQAVLADEHALALMKRLIESDLNGIWTILTRCEDLTKPVASIVKYPGKVIKVGSKGKDVERIQRAVGVKPDGIFGKGTAAAVKAYQKRKKLSADGIVGAKTWAVMF